MILFGASGHAKVILDILFLNKVEVEAVYDDNPHYEVIHGVQVKQNNIKGEGLIAIITIGKNETRKQISEKYKFNYISAIHPTAVISKYAIVGEGSVIMANAVVNPCVRIGRHCIINTSAVVEHDCILDDFVHISPTAALAGNVTIGEGTHIGIGAVVIQGVNIGKWCTVGAGAVIIKDIPDFSVVVGNPGKIIKQNIHEI